MTLTNHHPQQAVLRRGRRHRPAVAKLRGVPAKLLDRQASSVVTSRRPSPPCRSRSSRCRPARRPPPSASPATSPAGSTTSTATCWSAAARSSRRIRRQKSTQDLKKQAPTTVRRTKATATTAKKSAVRHRHHRQAGHQAHHHGGQEERHRDAQHREVRHHVGPQDQHVGGQGHHGRRQQGRQPVPHQLRPSDGPSPSAGGTGRSLGSACNLVGSVQSLSSCSCWASGRCRPDGLRLRRRDPPQGHPVPARRPAEQGRLAGHPRRGLRHRDRLAGLARHPGLLNVVGVVAAGVYLADLEPKLKQVGGGCGIVLRPVRSLVTVRRETRTAAPAGSSSTDQTLREWDAHRPRLRRREGIVLDRSAFYPGGGGQPPDHGVLLWGGVQTRIVGARKGDDLVPACPAEGDPVPPVGTPVRGAVEDDRRTALMRTHSGLHLLSRRRVPRLRRAGHRRQHGAARGPDGLQPARGAGGLQGPGRRGLRTPRSRPTGPSRSAACRATRRSRPTRT